MLPQSGGVQATTSASEDNLLLSTLSNYVFPRTGCKILATNRVYFDNIDGEEIGLEILLSQEIAVSSDDSGNSTATAVEAGPVSYDRVYKHVSRGFSGGTGGKSKFKMLLMAKDEETGQTIQPFQELEDVTLIKRLSTSPPSRVPTMSPTQINRASTQAPTVMPTKAPSSLASQAPTRSPQQPSALPGETILALTNSPTNDNNIRPLAPGKGNMGVDILPSPGNPAINRSSEPQGDSNDRDDIIPIAAIAAAAGAVAGIFVVGLMSLYRYRKELNEYRKRDRQQQLAVATTEIGRGRTKRWNSDAGIPSRHLSRPSRSGNGTNTSTTPQQKLVGARPPPPIPVIVNDDERSLAESTLGDRTAGRRIWAAPPPPVKFLKSSWIPGEGKRTSSAPASGASIAISQISSLDSGTIGAGGAGATIGEFSLEAAIKDDDSSGDEDGDEAGQPDAIRAGNSSVGSDASIADAGGDHDGSSENDDSYLNAPEASENSSSKGVDATLGLQPISEVASSAPSNTPSSLVGTASLFEASTLSLSDEATRTSASASSTGNNLSANASNVTPDNHVGCPEPPLDLTPRISGGGGRAWKSPILVDQEEGMENDESSSSDQLSYSLPQAILPERKRSVGSEASSPWSRAFAEGTAGVLSASFRGAENFALPPSTPSMVGKGTPRPGSPGDFPDSGPLVDPPASDVMSQTNGLAVATIIDRSMLVMEEGRQIEGAVHVTPKQDAEPASSDGDDKPSDDTRWLLKAVAGALGPPSRGADLESLSGRSNPSLFSTRSAPVLSSVPGKSRRSKSSRRSSTRSVGSRSSRHSHVSHGSEESRSIANDLQRLEVQLKMLNEGEKNEESPSVNVSAKGLMKSTPPPASPLSRHSAASSVRLDVVAPPGRLGVILANKSNDRGTVVTALRTSSALVGKILPGDVLLAVDGLDVSDMHVSEVTAIMSNKAQHEKVLTIVTPSKSDRE